MKEKEKTPKQMGDRKQDELYFSSLPMFYQEQKQLKEELNKIVLNKENNGTTK
jgi:HPt (histidine-containing phosphotransfer) domain-containing protein